MVYSVFSPPKELSDIVKQYVVIASLEGIDDLLFLPNGCNFIVFNRGLKGYTKIYNEDRIFPIPDGYSVSVKCSRVKRFMLDKDTTAKSIKFPLILVELTPIGFYKLFNKDASVLKNGYMEIESSLIDKYFKDLYVHKNIQEELEYLNSALAELQSSQNNTHMCIEDVIERIINVYHYEVTVKKLLEDFGCSRSKLEREFKKIIGVTPKNFIYIAKFCKTVLAYIEDKCTFNELEYLYSDHSHMNSVFKKFFGVNPSVVLNDVANKKIKIYQMQNNKVIAA